MAAVRVTPPTALPTIRQLGRDLAKWVLEAGPLSAAPHVPRQIDELQAALGNPLVLIEVWLDDGTSSEDAAHWLVGATAGPVVLADGTQTLEGLAGSRRVCLAFGTSTKPPRSSAGHVSPAMLVWMRGEESAAVEPSALEDRALVVATRRPASNEARAPQDHILVDRGEPDGVLTRLFASPAMAQTPDLFLADAGARALAALAAIAGLAFDQEIRAIRARRALAQQRAAAAQGRQTPVPLTELMGGLRSRLQRTFGDLARGIDERFASAFTSPAAPFWTQLDEQLAAIDAIHTDPRMKTVATRLPAEVEERWLETLRTALRHHCLADLGALRDTLRAAGRDVEKAVVQAGGPPLVVQFQQLTDDRLARILDAHVHAQRKYQGEIPKRGMFEYLMMARRYQTVVFMFLSAFGLSFLRTYREFMIPAAIALLSLGVLQVVHSVRRERTETLAKELEKVRDVLRTESRRVVSEVERAWPAVISQHLLDQLPIVLGNIETSMRDYFSRLTNEGVEERQRQQRQLQAFEAAERKLAAPIKAREGVAQAVAQVRGELRQLIAAAVRGATV